MDFVVEKVGVGLMEVVAIDDKVVVVGKIFCVKSGIKTGLRVGYPPKYIKVALVFDETTTVMSIP